MSRNWYALPAAVLVLAVGCREVTIKKFSVEPLYVCTGETIHFEWDINEIDKIKIYRNDNTLMHTGPAEGSWTSPPVQASWDDVRFKGCQGDNCESVTFAVHIIDDPEWTLDFVGSATGLLNTGTIAPIGGQEWVVADPYSSGDDQYLVMQLVEGFAINPNDGLFSPRARVLKLRPKRLDAEVLQVDVDGVFVESNGTPAMPRTWVPEEATSILVNPVPPRNRLWSLYYAVPETMVVAEQSGRGRTARRTDVSPTLLPAVKFYVKCKDPE